MSTTLSYLKIAVTFVWVGFICAISFMEAWLKFTAPGVTLVTGLSIGKIVFAALNRVEMVFALLILAGSLVRSRITWTKELYYLLAMTVLIVQSIWVLPVLTSRIDVYLDGGIPPPSSMHVIFVALEFIKVVALLLYGITQLSTWKA